jgi:hypothetical protein
MYVILPTGLYLKHMALYGFNVGQIPVFSCFSPCRLLNVFLFIFIFVFSQDGA